MLILNGLELHQNCARLRVRRVLNFMAARLISSVRYAKHIAVGILKPSHAHGSSRRGPDAEFVLTEARVEIESNALFAQGFHGRGYVRDMEAEYGVLTGREIGHQRKAQSDTANVENGGEAVFVSHGQPERVAIEGGGACAVSRADDDSRLSSLENSHRRLPFR